MKNLILSAVLILIATILYSQIKGNTMMEANSENTIVRISIGYFQPKQAGEVELTEFAVQESLQYEQRAARVQESLQQVEQQLNELVRKYEEMKHKLKDMHIKRMELMGKENIARANYRINQVLNVEDTYTKPVARFEEMESYLDQIEQQVNSNYYRHTIDARIAQLEKESKGKETNSISS